MSTLFVWAPKDLDDARRDAAVAEFRGRIQGSVGATFTDVMHSAAHFTANFGRYGGWDAWSLGIAREKDRFGRPAFAHFLVLTAFSSGSFGKATAMSIGESLRQTRPVHWMSADGTHGQLFSREIIVRDSTDFQYGWALR
jgi:hypothetical protein